MIEQRPHLDPTAMALALGGEARGNQVSAPSPGHSRKDRSLSFLVDDDAPDGFVIHSFVGEDALAMKDYVREKCGLGAWKPSASPDPKLITLPRATEFYIYQTADGIPYLRVTRMSDKQFRQSHWDGDRFVSGKPPGPKLPYRLPELLAANPDEPVFIVEGEKDVDRLLACDLVATTNSEGAGKWTAEMCPWLDGRQVFVIPDNDDVGRSHAASIKAQMPSASIIVLDDLPLKGDVSDWLNSGHTAAELIALTLAPPSDDALPTALAPTPFQWTDPGALPRRQWLYGRHLIRKYVSTTIAPGGLGKSSLVIVEALAMASGQELLGEALPAGALNVWYWNGEDGQDENRYRTVAAAAHHGLKPDMFAHRLWQDTGREKDLTLAAQGARLPFEINEAVVTELIAHIQANRIDVLIIDPFVAAHQVGENDNGAINAVVRALGRVAEFGNCAIELVHHIRKPGAGITADTDVNDARGASALIGGVRSARVLNVMSEDDAKTYDIKNRLAYFHVDNGKANLAPRSDIAVWRRIISFDLQNHADVNDPDSDKIGVVETWHPPTLFAGAIPNAAENAQKTISAGDYRYDHRSQEWAGFPLAPVCGSQNLLSPTHPRDRMIIRKMIDAWISSGVLVKSIEPDNQRHFKEFVRVGRPIYDQCADEYDPTAAD